MDLAVIGSGYVGLVASACFADCGNRVIGVDIDQSKVDRLSGGEVPIYEPGLEELLQRNRREGRLSFTTDLEAAVREADVVFIAVGTPDDGSGAADLSAIFAAAQGIAAALEGYTVVAIKSTVPVGTTRRVAEAIAGQTSKPFDVVSNPEFLKEGAAVDDFLKPDRIVIGTTSERAREVLEELYTPFVRTGRPILVMDPASSEMTKYASNALLATRITFINEVANACEHLGADVEEVRRGVGADSRLGPKFLFPGPGFGGSCFPKDVRALARTAAEAGYRFELLETVDSVNERQKERLAEKVLRHFGSDTAGLRAAVWGLSFKARTDDMRESPAIPTVERLLESGFVVRAYDPAARDHAEALFGDRIEHSATAYEALEEADVLVVVTEWSEFRNPDFGRMLELMSKPIMVDGRNIYDPRAVEEKGFIYYSIGRGSAASLSKR